MVSSDCLCGCSILLRIGQILLAVVLLTTVLFQTNKAGQLSLFSYYLPLLAAVCSVLFYGSLLTHRLLIHFSPILVLAGELINCALWKTSFVTSSYDFANNKPRSFSSWWTITTVGCTFMGFAFSTCALVLLCSGSVRHAWKFEEWKSREYFLLGGIFHRPGTKDACYEKQHSDEEWTEEGKPQTIYGANPEDLIITSQISLDLKYLMDKQENYEDSFDSRSEGYILDNSFSSDCQSTRSYASLEAPSEVSTMKGDNSEIQGIPFADGDNDDGGGDGWRRCSSTANGANVPQFYEE